MCYSAIGSSGGSYIALEAITTAVKYTRRDVRADWLMAATLLGTPLRKMGTYGRPRSPEHREFGKRLFILAEKWLQDGSIRNHPLETREGGLDNLAEGVEALRLAKVRGRKLVYPLLAD